MRKAATIGIIGGADGPTAVFLSRGSANIWLFLFLLSSIVVLGVVLLARGRDGDHK